MRFELFKKHNDPKLELIRDLIDELDDLYDDMGMEMNFSEGKDEYCGHIDKISIREQTILALCENKQEKPRFTNLISQN